MTRKKVKLAFIFNDSQRKATFKKRKRGLIKKVNELSTLCGINACAIVYSPFDANPDVWSSPSGVQRVVSEFRMLPETDQNKKMVDQESFLRQRIAKVLEHSRREKREKREREMTEVMFQILVGKLKISCLNILDLNDLGYIIDNKLKDLNHRNEILGNSGMEIGESSNVVAVHGSIGSIVERVATTSQFNQLNHNQHHQQQQQQDIPRESSTAPDPVGTNTNISVTSPNLSNNLWFR